MFRLASVALLAASSVAAFQDGDPCGVTSQDFMEAEYLGDYRVAGAGCSLSDGGEECFCAPDLADAENLSEWKWQCGETVQFGPKNDKVCPESVPVPKKYGVDSVSFSEAMLGVPVACDPALHPTGHPGDEVCGYSECEQAGGEYSAVCACVDLEARGVEGGGQQWFCLHATCQCEPEDSGMLSTSKAAAMLAAPLAVAAAALV